MNSFIKAAPGAQVWVCTKGAGGIPCSPLTPLVNISNVSISNPVTADQNGNYSFCVTTPNKYMVQIGGVGLTTVVQDGTIVPGDPQNPVITTLTVSGISTLGTVNSSSLNGPLGSITPNTVTATSGSFSNNLLLTQLNNTELIVDNFAGATSVERMAAAVSFCTQLASFTGCTFRITGALNKTQTFSGTIVYPLVTNGAGNNSLICNEGVLLNYTGSGYAVEAAATALNQTNAANVHIRNCHIQGSAFGLAGIHLRAFSVASIDGVEIQGFSNGDGVFCDGCNTTKIGGLSNIRLNRIGIHIATASTGFGIFQGAGVSCNEGTHIQSNTVWGWWEDPTVVGGVSNAPQGNVINACVVEGNGQATTSKGATGAASGTLVTITPTTSNPYVVGHRMTQSGFNNGTCYNGTFTVETATATTYTYHCTGGAATSTGGTVIGQSGQVYLQGSTNSGVRASFMQTTGAFAALAEVYFGDSTYACAACYVRDTYFASVNTTSTIEDISSADVVVDGNAEVIATTNFYNGASNGGSPRKFIGKNKAASANYIGGFFNLSDNNIVITSDGGIQSTYHNFAGATNNSLKIVGVAPGQSTSLNLRDPGVASTNISYTIGSGTSTTNGTAINTLTCQAQPAITVTGATVTDVAQCSLNAAAPATWQTGIFIQAPEVTANTVTYRLCNPTATATITPVATVVRCTVTR